MSYDLSYVEATRENSKAEIQAALRSFKNGGSVIMALAAILGAIADDMTANVMAKAQQLQDESNRNAQFALDNDGKKSPTSNENVLTAELQGLTQKLNMFMQAMNNVIKTLGEANGNVARKG